MLTFDFLFSVLVNTPGGTSSGNVHGMPVAFLMGLIENMNALPSLDWYKPCLKPQDIVYIGLRDVDGPERETIRRLGIKAFSVGLIGDDLYRF